MISISILKGAMVYLLKDKWLTWYCKDQERERSSLFTQGTQGTFLFDGECLLGPPKWCFVCFEGHTCLINSQHITLDPMDCARLALTL